MNAIEHEIGADGERTGRIRAAQFYRVIRGDLARWEPWPSPCSSRSIRLSNRTTLPSARIPMPFGAWTVEQARAEARKDRPDAGA